MTLGLIMVACDTGSPKIEPPGTEYRSLVGNDLYVLSITEKAKAAYSPGDGDSYVLSIAYGWKTNSSQQPKVVSSGTVTLVPHTGGGDGAQILRLNDTKGTDLVVTVVAASAITSVGAVTTIPAMAGITGTLVSAQNAAPVTVSDTVIPLALPGSNVNIANIPALPQPVSSNPLTQLPPADDDDDDLPGKPNIPTTPTNPNTTESPPYYPTNPPAQPTAAQKAEALVTALGGTNKAARTDAKVTLISGIVLTSKITIENGVTLDSGEFTIIGGGELVVNGTLISNLKDVQVKTTLNPGAVYRVKYTDFWGSAVVEDLIGDTVTINRGTITVTYSNVDMAYTYTLAGAATINRGKTFNLLGHDPRVEEEPTIPKDILKLAAGSTMTVNGAASIQKDAIVEIADTAAVIINGTMTIWEFFKYNGNGKIVFKPGSRLLQLTNWEQLGPAYPLIGTLADQADYIITKGEIEIAGFEFGYPVLVITGGSEVTSMGLLDNVKNNGARTINIGNLFVNGTMNIAYPDDGTYGIVINVKIKLTVNGSITADPYRYVDTWASDGNWPHTGHRPSEEGSIYLFKYHTTDEYQGQIVGSGTIDGKNIAALTYKDNGYIYIFGTPEKI